MNDDDGGGGGGGKQPAAPASSSDLAAATNADDVDVYTPDATNKPRFVSRSGGGASSSSSSSSSSGKEEDDGGGGGGGGVGAADITAVTAAGAYTSSVLNEWESSEAAQEGEGIALLRQIFPDESTAELKRIHRERLVSAAATATATATDSAKKKNNNADGKNNSSDGNPHPCHSPNESRTATPQSKLGRRLWEESRKRRQQRATAASPTTNENGDEHPPSGRSMSSSPPPWREAILPHDFLRLPHRVAVRRYDGETGRWQYHLVGDMSRRAWERHRQLAATYHDRLDRPATSEEEEGYYTRSIFRDPRVGLGLSLYEHRGTVRVHSLSRRDGTAWHPADPPSTTADYGPSLQARVRPGDVLVGINGTALLECITSPEALNADGILLKHAVSRIHNSPDPIVLHLQRGDETAATYNGEPYTPRVVTLPLEQAALQSLLDTSDILDESQLSNEQSSSFYNHFSERTFHSTPMMEDVASTPFIHPFVVTLRKHGLLQSFEDERTCTLMLSQFTERTRQWEAASCFHIVDEDDRESEIFIPLMGVRKALCVRIVHSFVDGNESAFTTWVYDVETGNEWYAPIRYFRDFQDLRSALLHLIPSITQLPFPKQPLSIFGSPVRQDSPYERETKCRMLEYFLRSLCTLIYRDALHPAVAEIAIHVQSFLGCENVSLGSFLSQAPAPLGVYSLENGNVDNKQVLHVRHILKRSIQLYTYRLFLIARVSAVVNTFIDSVRAKGPRLEDLEALEAQGRAVLKARAMDDLEQMKAFLDKMQDLIMEGCQNEFLSIAERDEYEAIHGMIHGKKGQPYWDRLVREAVREQVEIEVYVPLRSIVSRWLVQGWRHEDMEVQFKIKELRKRPQQHVRIRQEKIDPNSWSSASKILKEGVGMSTLPCAKLRAIVESAREISRLFVAGNAPEGSGKDENGATVDEYNLGADDFLPIFIYCVVQAELERPCALCVLLRALCDPINRLGEIGYYLASFEAAITHIQEVDLTEERDASFLSVPLGDP